MERSEGRHSTTQRKLLAAAHNVLKTHTWVEIGSAEPASYIIKGVLYRNSLCAVIGATGSGKTFFVMDLAYHVAGGVDWRGQRVKQAGVLYIALEGGAGIANRVVALKVYHNAWGEGEGEPPELYLTMVSLDLLNDASATSKVIQTALGLKTIGLIVIDTLARAMVGGDENTSVDMGKFIFNLDRIRQETGACIMVVHHLGKDASRGARGHSSLRAAIDTEIEVTKLPGGSRAAKITKQKEGAAEAEFHFELDVANLGMDEDGDAITSCICLPTDGLAGTTRKQQIPRAAQTLLRALQEAITEKGEVPPANDRIPTDVRAVPLETARKHAYDRGISTGNRPDAQRKAFVRSLQHLLEDGLIGVCGDWVWLI